MLSWEGFKENKANLQNGLREIQRNPKNLMQRVEIFDLQKKLIDPNKGA